MARIYGIKDRREIGIAEDRRRLLARRHRISAELGEALRSGDGRAVYAALLADARKPDAWFPGTIRAAIGRAHKTKSPEAFAQLVEIARDVYVNCAIEDLPAARCTGA